MSIASRIGSLFSRKACPVRIPAPPKPPMTLRHVLPLAGFVIPTVAIGYGLVIPRSCIAGVNELTIGFATTIVGACITYVAGVRSALATGRG